MSLTRRVAEMVQEMGCATLQEILPLLEGYTRMQVFHAMKNARSTGLVHCRGHVPLRGKGSGAGSAQATHYPGRRDAKPEKPKPPRPVASVWELGTPRLDALPVMPGRQYQPLGGWTDEGATGLS